MLRLSALVVLFVILLSAFCCSLETVGNVRPGKDTAGKMLPPYPQPVLITSIGQGASASVVGALLPVRAGITAQVEPAAATGSLAGVRTLVLVLDVSTTALQKLGTHLGEEEKRADAFLTAVEKMNMPVVLMMLGDRISQRQNLQPLADKLMAKASCLVVKQSGGEPDPDYFLKKAAELEIPTRIIRLYGDLVPLAKELFSRQIPTPIDVSPAAVPSAAPAHQPAVRKKK